VSVTIDCGGTHLDVDSEFINYPGSPSLFAFVVVVVVVVGSLSITPLLSSLLLLILSLKRLREEILQPFRRLTKKKGHFETNH